ncbi:MAG: hypothetical protein ACE5EA_09115 [Nitrospirota bacterium]
MVDLDERERYRYVSEGALMREEMRKLMNELRPDISAGRRIVAEEKAKERLRRKNLKKDKKQETDLHKDIELPNS